MKILLTILNHIIESSNKPIVVYPVTIFKGGDFYEK